MEISNIKISQQVRKALQHHIFIVGNTKFTIHDNLNKVIETMSIEEKTILAIRGIGNLLMREVLDNDSDFDDNSEDIIKRYESL